MQQWIGLIAGRQGKRLSRGDHGPAGGRAEHAVRAALGAIEGVQSLELKPGEQGSFDVELSSDESLDLREAVFAACAKANLPLLNMQLEQISLEDVFRQLTSDDAPETEKKEARAE